MKASRSIAIEADRGSASASAETLSRRVAATLRSAITRGEVMPGAKMHLDDLRESLGVSLSPLREALARLGAEGFVVAEDQRGYRVAPVSEANLREITCLRLVLEPMALRESIRNGDSAWEGNIVASAHHLSKHRLQKAPGSGAKYTPEWEVAHRKFHESLLSGSGMPLLFQFCMTLYDLSDRYRGMFFRNMERQLARLAIDDHKKIAAAAVARNEEAAAKHLRAHIERVSNLVLKSIATKGVR
jgi:DNA-binding GntR family transcriptional regulator